LEDRHDQGVDDAKSSNRKSEAAEDGEKKIQNAEKRAQAFRNIEKRECAKAKLLEFGFRGFHQRRAFDAHGEAGVGGLVARRIAKNVAQVVDLRGAQSFGDRKRDEQTAAAEASEPGSRFSFHNSDNTEVPFFRNDRKTAGVLPRFAALAMNCLASRVAEHITCAKLCFC